MPLCSTTGKGSAATAADQYPSADEVPKDVAEHGFATLHKAAQQGHTAAVQQLLEAGAAVNSIAHGSTALHIAARSGHVALVQLLLARHAAVNIEDGEGWTALHIAACSDDTAVVQLLLDAQAAVDIAEHGSRCTALHMAACNGHTAVVQQLLNRHAATNFYNCEGHTALHMAACNGHIAIVQLLLAADAAVGSPQRGSGCTALHMAACNGHTAVVQLLLDARAAVAPSRSPFTALHLAAQGGHAAVVQLLLQRLPEATVTAAIDAAVENSTSYSSGSYSRHMTATQQASSCCLRVAGWGGSIPRCRWKRGLDSSTLRSTGWPHGCGAAAAGCRSCSGHHCCCRWSLSTAKGSLRGPHSNSTAPAASTCNCELHCDQEQVHSAS
jgi:ankyrin repeat protein